MPAGGAGKAVFVLRWRVLKSVSPVRKPERVVVHPTSPLLLQSFYRTFQSKTSHVRAVVVG